MSGQALISVVIPTRGRPEFVTRAVESALRQSYAPHEVIVVIDGPDPETTRALRSLEDKRLRVIGLDENVGGSEARNIGIRAAQGEWVALLDDDDYWLPAKLKRQLETALGSQARYPIVSSRLLAEGPDGDRILPRRLYQAGENISDYIFCRRGFSYGEGMLQTSTLLAKRELLLYVPFLKGLKRHQDWDWLLKVAGRPEAMIQMLPEALTCMRVGTEGDSVSQAADWKASLAWVKTARPLMSARAYTFFVATECVPRARKSRAGPGVQMLLFWECLRNGRFGWRQLMLFLAFSMLPNGVRNRLRAWKTGAGSARKLRECQTT